MWYLILPPIVVVASLLFVLWYLSRKGADPLMAAKASELERESEQKVPFLRIRTFFLRLLEKTAYRFKIGSLKMHNELHSLTQSLKESQQRFKSKAAFRELPGQFGNRGKALAEEGLPVPQAKSVQRFFERDKEAARKRMIEADKEPIVFSQAKDVAGNGRNAEGNNEASKQEEKITAPDFRASRTMDTPIVRSRKEGERSASITKSGEVEVAAEAKSISRPMVSERLTHPERVQKKVVAPNIHEEDFIARIAVNPKDFTAYEGLGDYYLEMNNVKDAKECYRQVLKLSPVQRMVKIKIRRLEKILSQQNQRA